MKKLILVTSSIDESNKKYTLHDHYCKAIESSGGIPIITSFENTEHIDQLLDVVGGVLLSGGGDIHSKHFNEELHEKASLIYEPRDNFEIELCKKALERDIPILCICRGMQLVNVVLGGSLHQHIEGHVNDTEDLMHPVKIVENSYFEKIYGNKTFEVTSLHHQAIKDLGRNVEVIAYSEDNIVEAVKVNNKTFVVGLQYHPERIYDKVESKILFDEFIKYCNLYENK